MVLSIYSFRLNRLISKVLWSLGNFNPSGFLFFQNEEKGLTELRTVKPNVLGLPT